MIDITPTFQGIYTLHGRMPYRKISRMLEVARVGFKLFQSKRYDHYNTQSRVKTVKRPSAQHIHMVTTIDPALVEQKRSEP